MAVSGTYGTMIDRIESEIGRSDLTSDVKNAIQTAISHYERKRFYFNEFIDSLSASTSQEFYTSADFATLNSVVEIDSLTIDDNNTTYPLIERSWSYMEQAQTRSQYVGTPTDYVRYAQRLRLYPIPDESYVLHVSGVKKLATLSATTDTNAWMVDGEALIRARAKAELYLHKVQKPEKAVAMNAAEKSALAEIEAETNKYIAAKIKATQF
jgi:hypothetical protein